MDVAGVVRELRELNKPPPPYLPGPDETIQIRRWMAWSAGEVLIAAWEEQCNKRTQGAQPKAAESTSMRGMPSKDYIGRTPIG